jgi:hypothetical protein
MALLTGGVAQGDRQMRFAQADGTEKHDVGVVFEEGEAAVMLLEVTQAELNQLSLELPRRPKILENVVQKIAPPKTQPPANEAKLSNNGRTRVNEKGS